MRLPDKEILQSESPVRLLGRSQLRKCNAVRQARRVHPAYEMELQLHDQVGGTIYRAHTAYDTLERYIYP